MPICNANTFIILLIFSLPVFSDIDIIDTHGLYDRFKDPYKYLSPENGLLVLKSGVLNNVRSCGNYGKENPKFLCHRQITKRDSDCPQDHTTAIIQHLFPTPAGGTLTVSNAQSDFFKHVTIEQIGRLINALLKDEKTVKNTLSFIKKKFDSQSISDISAAWRDAPTNVTLDQLLTSYASMLLGAKTESKNYPRNLVEHALLALAIKKAEKVSDLDPLLNQLRDIQYTDLPAQPKFSKKGYDDFKINIQKDNNTIKSTTIEELIFYTLAYDKYDNPFPPMIGTGKSSFDDVVDFSDCGESAKRNLFNLFLSDANSRSFKSAYLSNAFPKASPKLLNFYEEIQKTYDDVEHSELRSKWANVVAGLNVGIGPKVFYSKNRCEIEGIGIDNSLAVIERLLNDPEIAKVRENEKNDSKRRKEILNYIFDKFSRPGLKFDWETSFGDKHISDKFVDITISVNGVKEFLWNIEDLHFELSPISGEIKDNDWRKNTAIAPNYVSTLPNGLNQVLLPFYLNYRTMREAKLPSDISPSILFGLRLFDARQKLLAINITARLSHASLNYVTNRWLEDTPDGPLNRQVVITVFNLLKNVPEWKGDYTKEKFPRAYQKIEQEVKAVEKKPKKIFNYFDFGEPFLTEELILALLQNMDPINFDIKNSAGVSLLELAIYGKFIAVVDFILKQVPHLALEKNSDGETLLHRAAKTGSLDLIRILVDKAPNLVFDDLLIKDRDGMTPVGWAALLNNFDIVNYLVEKAPKMALFKFKSGFRAGQTLLNIAIMDKAPDLVRLLLMKAPELITNKEWAIDAVGKTLIIYAEDTALPPRNLEMLKIIAEASPTLLLKESLKEVRYPETKQLLEQELAKPDRPADGDKIIDIIAD